MPKVKSATSFKEAETNYPIHELLQKRWSPRAFADKSVDPELLEQLFEAARWAPSSFNEQPWRFIFARKEDNQAFSKLCKVMNEYNQSWAAEAPVLVLGITKKNFDLNGRPNKHAGHDLGQSLAHLTFEATYNGLFVHQMAGILPEKAHELYNISEKFEPLTMVAIGYLGEAKSLSDKLKEKEQAPRTRKEFKEIIFNGEWTEE